MTTRYLGLQLKNPLIASSSPLTGQLDMLKQLEDAGTAAVVLPSLFEEQIEHEESAIHDLHEMQTESFAESLDYFPELDSYNTGPDHYLEQIRCAKQALDIPVIASLNCTTPGGWVRYARMIHQAGADALELNVYVIPVETDLAGTMVEQRCVDLVQSVREAVSLPLAVKIGPLFSSIPSIAQRMVDAGADGLVLFNRCLAPDIDLETLDVVPHLSLSSSEELRLPLRWIAILHGQIKASLAATGGFHQRNDVLKALLAGADVTMMASAILQHGPAHIGMVLEQLRHWMIEREYASVEQLKGSVSRTNCSNASAYMRADYMKALISYNGNII